jgi:hypothetical protein
MSPLIESAVKTVEDPSVSYDEAVYVLLNAAQIVWEHGLIRARRK